MDALTVACALCAVVQARAEAVGARLTRQDVVVIATAVEKATKHHDDVPQGLVLAVIENETRYRVHSVGADQDYGAMQVRRHTYKDVLARTAVHWRPWRYIHRVDYNVMVGTAYLAMLKRQFKTWRRALTAYNRGPAAFTADGRHNGYARRVLRRWRRIRALTQKRRKRRV